jgi:hypothetical protein
VRAVRLLEADRDFARAVPAEDRALADRALAVRLVEVRAGVPVACDPSAVALVVLDGALWREVNLAGTRGPQLLAPGAILLPEPPAGDLLTVRTETMALTSARLAQLDRRFLLAATRWPELMAIYQGRLAQQERDLGVLAAIGHLARVDDRIMALMWHLAERWGTVRAGGVHLPLRLTHATLGRFVAARRPTVSLALTDLRESGKLLREPDGTWTLAGVAPKGGETAIDPRDRTGPPDLFPGGTLNGATPTTR